MDRIKRDKRVNFKYDWKMVTISIGGNDICSFICIMKDPESLPDKHRAALTKTLRYLKKNLPRFEFKRKLVQKINVTEKLTTLLLFLLLFSTELL